MARPEARRNALNQCRGAVGEACEVLADICIDAPEAALRLYRAARRRVQERLQAAGSDAGGRTGTAPATGYLNRPAVETLNRPAVETLGKSRQLRPPLRVDRRNAQLPPEIMVDRHLVRAERLLPDDNPDNRRDPRGHQ